MPRSQLKEAIDRFARKVIELTNDHLQLKINVALPAYILELIDPLLLLSLRELNKRGILEWIMPGYTEPFFTFSPPWISMDNISHGISVFKEFTGDTPSGIAPPFSNWEPSLVNQFHAQGLEYAVVSNGIFSEKYRSQAGFWITESSGSTMVLFGANVIRNDKRPPEIIPYIEEKFAQDNSDPTLDKSLVLEYLIPLETEFEHDYWLDKAIHDIIDRVIIYQTARFQEIISSISPIGLQFLPSSLCFTNAHYPTNDFFVNYLYSFNQVGIMQRKMIDVCEQVTEIKSIDSKLFNALRQRLFFAQDINRYLPGIDHGFTVESDRAFTFSHLIAIEKELSQLSKSRGGTLRITEFLRNGTKCLIMANKGLQAYIDHRNGGHLFELDYRDRNLNVISAFNPNPHDRPIIVSSLRTRSSFIDRFFSPDHKMGDLIGQEWQDLGNFSNGRFEYKVKRVSNGIRCVLTKQGSVIQAEKNCPLTMEKVFGLERDASIVSFSYKLTNGSITPYDFRFGIELNFSLSGMGQGGIELACDGEIYKIDNRHPVPILPSTKWHLDDRVSGIRIQLQTQKPLEMWCIPYGIMDKELRGMPGFTMLLSSRIALQGTNSWSNTGKVWIRRLRRKGSEEDEI